MNRLCYATGVNVKTGEIFKATFPDKGPAIDVRSACHFAGCDKVQYFQFQSNTSWNCMCWVPLVARSVFVATKRLMTKSISVN